MRTLSKIFTPLNYYFIKHPLKNIFDIYIPLAITLFMFMAFYLFRESVPISGDGGFLSSVSNILQMLTGFFIASLAAVATFESKILDDLFDGEQATLLMNIKGVEKEYNLSRRRFLSYLFGYLSFLSFVLYFTGVFANLFVSGLASAISCEVFFYLKWLFLLLYLFLLSNLLVTTLLGLHYMADRIHR